MRMTKLRIFYLFIHFWSHPPLLTAHSFMSIHSNLLQPMISNRKQGAPTKSYNVNILYKLVDNDIVTILSKTNYRV